MAIELKKISPHCLGLALLLSSWGCGSTDSSPASGSSGNGGGHSGHGSGASSGSPTLSGSGSGDIGSPGGSGTGGGASSGSGSAGSGTASGAPDDGGSSGTAASDASSGTQTSDGGGSSPDGSTGGGACTRDGLTAAINAYFTALAAHDPTKAPLASGVKYTENGKVVQVGMGEWTTAGAVKFKRSALDTSTCNSVTEAVITDSGADLVYGLRLKLDSNQKITEIETIPVHSGSYITINAAGLSGTSMDNWETVLPAAQQGTRDALQALMDTYFTRFPNGACNFASDCMRVEDGASIGSCTGFGVGCTMTGGSTTPVMTARIHVIDVEAGISVGFTMFAGAYTDFHMFKVRGGQVHGVHAILSSATSSGW